MMRSHVQVQLWNRSASSPCVKGSMAPPTTPINNTPVARAVYFPSPSRDKEKIAPHIREWKSPTPISNQGILRRMASTTKSPAQKVLTASCMWALIIERKLEKKRPTSIENQ